MIAVLAQLESTERIEAHVELARWSVDSALIVGALATGLGLYAVGWMYRREARGRVSPRLRWTLVALRVFLLVTLGLIGLEPVLVNYVHRRVDAYTIFLADESASMSLSDAFQRPEDAARAAAVAGEVPPGGVPRIDLARKLLGDPARGLLEALSKRNKVFFAGFAEGIRPRGVIPTPTGAEGETADTGAASETSPTLEASGAATDVAASVRAAIESLGGAPIAGVVLLSDGGFNSGESPEVVAEMLARRGIPLRAVGVGDPSPPVNVAVTEVDGPRWVFRNDPFSITARLEAKHLERASLRLELLERPTDRSGPARVVDRREVSVSAQGQVEPVSFDRKVERSGSVSYVVRVAPVEYESNVADNEREILPAVQVLEDRMRVLVVAGAPSYDYRFAARLLERDTTVDLSTWLQSADAAANRDGNTIITELPQDQEALFRYDAILLIDPDPEQLAPTWCSLLASFVGDHGGGVLYAAGNKFSEKFFRSANVAPLVELLPIVPDPDAEILLNELGQYQTRAWPLLIPEHALGDPILRQSGNPSENRAIWAALDGLYWHFPVRRAKPLAQALIRHSNPRMVGAEGPHVLLAAQLAGSGRCVFLGFNSTWRWRRHDETYFNRFWIQALRYLVEGRLLGGRSHGSIMTPRDHFELGETVRITVRALDERFEPLMVPELELLARPTSAAAEEDAPEPARVGLVPVMGREGTYEGRFIPRRAGAMELSVTLPGAVPGRGPVLEKSIRVTRSALEMRETAMNRAALEQLARASGGRYYEMDEAGEIAEAIPDASHTIVTRERPRPLWDNGYLLGLLVGLATVEWALRRKARLL